MRQRLLRRLTGRLFLGHPLLERGDLFAGPPVLLVRLPQLSVRRFQLGFQANKVFCSLLRCGTRNLFLLTHLRHLLQKCGTFLLKVVLSLFQLGGCLGQRLLCRLASRLFLHHPLLQRSDLFISPPVLLVRLPQLPARRLQLSLQAEKAIRFFLHHDRLSRPIDRQLDGLLLRRNSFNFVSLLRLSRGLG